MRVPTLLLYIISTAYCAANVEPFDNTWWVTAENKQIKLMTEVLQTLFRMLLMLRSSVLSNDAHALSERGRCLDKGKKLMKEEAMNVANGRAKGFRRAAFLYVWGDFIVLKQTTDHVR